MEYSDLAGGTWTFRVAAKDALGNAWQLPYSYSWRVEPNSDAAHAVFSPPPPRVVYEKQLQASFQLYGTAVAVCRLFSEEIVEGDVASR